MSNKGNEVYLLNSHSHFFVLDFAKIQDLID